ncbi:MAG: YsnF/AvaK domain-containing protein [Janthinobacterium lividum]
MTVDKTASVSAAALQTGGTVVGKEAERVGLDGAASFIATDEAVLRLYAEQIAVARHKLERKVQVHLRTVSRDHAVDELLTHERVEIERVPIGRQVEAIPANRQEGDTTIIPVVEEVVVVHRQLVLKEEIRMRRVRVTEHHRETVTLREQEARVEREDSAALAADDTSTAHKDSAP